MESFPKPVGIQAILDGKQKSQFQSGDIMTRFQKNLFPISRALIQWVMSFQLVWQHVTNQGEVASQIQTNFFFIIVCKMTKMLIFKHKSALINCLPGIPSTLDQTQGKKKKRQYNSISAKGSNEKYNNIHNQYFSPFSLLSWTRTLPLFRGSRNSPGSCNDF